MLIKKLKFFFDLLQIVYLVSGFIKLLKHLPFRMYSISFYLLFYNYFSIVKISHPYLCLNFPQTFAHHFILILNIKACIKAVQFRNLQKKGELKLKVKQFGFSFLGLRTSGDGGRDSRLRRPDHLRRAARPERHRGSQEGGQVQGILQDREALRMGSQRNSREKRVQPGID